MRKGEYRVSSVEICFFYLNLILPRSKNRQHFDGVYAHATDHGFLSDRCLACPFNEQHDFRI